MASKPLRKELLLSAYVRLNYNEVFPEDIILLLSNWIILNCELFFKYCGDTLLQFYNKKDRKPMPSKYDTVNLEYNISIRCRVYPNIYKNHCNKLVFHFNHQIPSTISSFEYYLEIGCEEITNSISKTHKAVIIGYGKDIVFNEYNFPMSKFKDSNKDKLTFYVYIELLRLIQKQVFDTIYLMKPVVLNSQIQYEWIIDDEIINELRNDENGTLKYYSSNIANDCMALFIKRGVIGLCFFKIPYEADEIEGNVKIKINMNRTVGSYIYIEFGRVYEYYFDFDASCNNINKLVLKMTINITKIQKDSQYISKNKWYQYGVNI